MAGGRETPRQRLIGILYLVLLGLIALDVPDSLLDAFKQISDSLSASQNNVQLGIDNTISAFEKSKLKDEHERAQPIYDRAKAAQKAADDVNNYIKAVKDYLVTKSGGINPNTNDYVARDNMDASVRMMVEQGRAKALHQKIDSLKAKLSSLLKDNERASVSFSLEAKAPPHRSGYPDKDWENANFGEGIPLGAVMTTLTKVQSDLKNDESQVIKKILGEMDQAIVTLDQFNAVAVAPTSYVIAGQPYTAQVFLTAYDSKSNPKITVNGSSIPVSAGKGTYTVNTGSEGVFTWNGSITVMGADGKPKSYPIPTQTYQVARPSAVVSPDKMNVLYIGVPNPLSVSAPGIPKEKLHVSMSSGSLSGSAGHYTATVSSVGETTITVSGDMGKGSVTLGSTRFRIKRIPDPKAVFAGRSSGSTGTANLKAQDKLFARLEGFDFDTHFEVTRFTMMIARPRQDAVIMQANGAELTGAMRAALAGITPGTRVIFSNIAATGPGGLRGLDDIVLAAN